MSTHHILYPPYCKGQRFRFLMNTSYLFSFVLPFFTEKDLLQDAHLTVPLSEFLCAVGPVSDQAAS